MVDVWPTRPIKVASLLLDLENPRLGRDAASLSPREVVRHLFDHDKAMDVAVSIATRGYFPNEPLLAIKQGKHYVVVEGNRRLAALKALCEPGLLDGAMSRRIKNLKSRITDEDSLNSVPVTIAPDRRATDRQIAGRHVGTPVLPWEAENRAIFILSKLAEGYTTSQLKDELDFNETDIQAARRTKALADMVRALELDEDVKKKLESPRAKVLSTLERVFDSSVGRAFMHAEPDAEHGLRITTSKDEFTRALTLLITDIATKKQTSRSLNTNENMQEYFKTWKKGDRPTAAHTAIFPNSITGVAPPPEPKRVGGAGSPPKRARKASDTVLPRDFKVRVGAERLGVIRDELVKIKRDQLPNAGAVLLRVFVELAVTDYLDRTGALKTLVADLNRKNGLSKATGQPTMRQLADAIIAVAKKRLPKPEAQQVEKALKVDKAAKFNLSELHSFVHNVSEHPGGHDLLQFWKRTEPLFRLMLERDAEADE